MLEMAVCKKMTISQIFSNNNYSYNYLQLEGASFCVKQKAGDVSPSAA